MLNELRSSLHRLDKSLSLLFVALFSTLLLVQLLLFALLAAIPCADCHPIEISIVPFITGPIGLLYVTLVAPWLETLLLAGAIVLVCRVSQNRAVVCLSCGVFFGGLHGLEDGPVRWLFAAWAFSLFSYAYFLFKDRSKHPILLTSALHAANNICAAAPLAFTLLR